MGNHRITRKRSAVARTVGGGLIVGGMALGAIALTTAAVPVEANAACGNGISAFSMSGVNNPNTVNLGSGNNFNFQGGFLGANTLTGGQTSGTGNNTSTNSGNTTTCTAAPSLFPSFGFGSNTGLNNPNTFNVLSGNNINAQFSPFGANTVLGGQTSSTGNNGSTNTGNVTTTTG